MSGKFKNVIFLLILGTCCTSLLVGFSRFSSPIIEKFNETKLRATILDAAGIPYTKDTIDEKFNKIKEMDAGGFKYYVTPENNYIFKFRGRGLWDMIDGVLSLNPDLKTIEKVRVVSQKETPGLGARITEEPYLEAFEKKIADPKLILSVRSKASGNDQIDTISGATITAQAFVDMINNSIGDFRKSEEKKK